MEYRDTHDIASEIAFLYLKLFGVAMSAYLLIIADDALSIVISVILLVFFSFAKYEWKTTIKETGDK